MRDSSGFPGRRPIVVAPKKGADDRPDMNVWLLARVRFWIVMGWVSQEEAA